MKNKGVIRIVTPRELSIPEIKKIKENCDIEIESFVHGALCYCYSGQCLLSSYIGGRSGNRGRCAQPCRMEYDVVKNGKVLNPGDSKYVLSPKDICTLKILPDIIESGVYSLKIEGRMKKPEYTAGVVSIYRKYINLYLQFGRKKYKVDNNDIKKLNDLFNRKGFSESYYKTYNGKEMITFSKPDFRAANEGLIKGIQNKYINTNLRKNIDIFVTIKKDSPTEEMLEQSRRLEHSIVECPAARQTGVKEFFHILEDKMDKKRLAVWDGELYLEFHRGTYTSMAQNKKYNRKAEFKNGETELYAAMASLLDQKYLYPQEQLEHSWKLLLLNQFHDILPGSSIKEVYEDSAAQYEEIFAADEEMMKTAKKSIREKLFRYRAEKNEEVCAVWNPLSFARTALIRNAEGSWQKITAGPSGVTVCRAVNSGEDNCFTELVMEENGRPVSFKTPYFTVRFDANAEITSLVDIREDRELIQKGRMGNRLTVYEDRPAEFDAWNIDEGYLEKSWDVIDVEEFKVLENGPETAALHVRRRFQDSMIEQTIRFYRHTARIDFQTRVDWQEHQQLLRVSFPVDVLAHEADYEIQFGNVKRPTHKNTSWDRARFEVCAHKWADLSEPGYGVALMNDCKYGYDVHEGVMGLTLIKSGIFPNPDADQGQHEFTYALFPHQGDFRKGSVVREAYDLNCPMAWEKVQGIYEDSFSMLQIAEENVMADTVKAAEDGNGIIVRIYETWGMRTKVHVNFPLAPDAQVTVCDCMENFSGVENADMTRVQDGWSFTMKPYEIKTLRIVNEKK